MTGQDTAPVDVNVRSIALTVMGGAAAMFILCVLGWRKLAGEAPRQA